MPRLPVTAARKTFSDTSTTAEPTDPSAAMRFSRLACSIVVEGIREIIRCDAGKTGASEYPDCVPLCKGANLCFAGDRAEKDFAGCAPGRGGFVSQRRLRPTR